MNYSNAMELLSASRLGVILVSEDLRILDANSSAEKLLENRLPLKGRSLSEAAPFLLSPDSEGRCINAGFRRYLRLSPCPEGIEVPVGTRLICFEEISGDVFRHILETIVNLICEPMILTDTEQRVLFINNATMRMESLLPEEVLGKKITEIYPSAQTNSSNFSFNELTVPHVLRTREPLVNCRQQYTTVHGKQMDISCSSYPVFYGGDICGVFCLTADLSRAEELSKRVIELQGQLLKKSGSAAARTGGSRQNRLSAKYSFRDIIFQSRSMYTTVKKCQLCALSDSPVMLYGETGTGKELFAQSIHNASRRSEGPFLAINCAAIPENLLESLLFGTEKGAYTGAEKRPGLFEQADGGTLLLDELNSMSLFLQAKLLRVLQDGMVRRVGGMEEKKVDVRVISNINIPPYKAVEEGIIREDVFYRLSVISISIPPLRERKEDIPLLARTFYVQMNSRLNKNVTGISEDVLSLFSMYDWPGNVRELQHCIEHAMNLTAKDETEIRRQHLPELFLRRMNQTTESPSEGEGPDALNEGNTGKLDRILSDVEQALIRDALSKNSGNISRTAKALGISRQNLQHRLKRCRIDPR